jgi:putative ABC transport system permease protein
VDAKARLFVGSDVAAIVGSSVDPPEDFAFPITKVFRIPHAGRPEGGPEIDVLAVDPASLSEVAHWDRGFGEPDLEAAIGPLRSATARSRSTEGLPAILAGEDLGEEVGFDIAGDAFTFDVVNEVAAFPGMVSERPLLVVTIDSLTQLLESRSSGLLNTARVNAEWWVKGEPGAVEAALARAEAPPSNTLTAAEVRDIPSISAVIDTFRVLDLLGSGAALLVIVAMLMYLQARKRSRVVSYALARRMGLTHRNHGIALVAELAALLLASYAIALLVATVASWLVAVMVDPLPTIPPETLFTIPAPWLALSAVALGTVAALAGIATNATGGRSDLGSLMRVAE